MLYGIIADVHGNLEALEAVLKQLKKADKIICTGDIIGYGPNPNECLEKVKKLEISSVAGNHEKAVAGKAVPEWFNESARKAVVWTQRKIFQENLEYIRNLPQVLEENGFQIVHGSLRSPLEEYVSSIAEALPTFSKMSKPLCFTGHFHRPLFIALKKDGNYDGRILRDGDEVLVDEYEKVIINPGGVGQPRDGDPRASYGLYDSKTGIFSLHRVEYDIDKVQKKMKKAGLPTPLIDRLPLGR
ncbi:metallophosphoesterase family protein [Candidatus Margulisiibacteriota bacterium]